MTTATSPHADPAPRARVAPTFGRGLLVALIYAAVFLVAGLVSGVDYDEISESTSNVFGFVVVPVGLGILVTLAVTARWGWWRALFHEAHRLAGHRWIRALPVLIALVIVVNLVIAPWHEFGTGLVLLLLAGCLLVGFGEEIIFRGYLLLGARARWSERGAWFVTSLLFGLFHGLNIFTGQSVPATVQQIVFAFVFGSAFYLVRRVTGLLVVGMVLHGLWDFTSFVSAGRGEQAATATSHVAVLPFMLLTVLTTVAALIVLFRRDGESEA